MTATQPGPHNASPTLTGESIAWREAVMHLYKPNDPTTGTVVKSEICTAAKKAAGFVRHIEIDVSGTNLVGQCQPGQSIGVLAPGVDAAGKPHKLRLYSLANPSSGEDGSGAVISTTVKRSIDEHWDTHKLFQGVCSNYLCDLQVGDKVALTGPSGKKFVLPKNLGDHDYIFFATGTGIAPFRGMVIDILRSKANSRVALIMGSPYSTDLLYDAQFREMAKTHSNFTYIPTISRETNGADPRLYVQDRLRTDRSVLEPLLRGGKALIYVCGIAGMELGILQELSRFLKGSDLEQFLSADEATMGAIDGWNRSMLHKQIHLTRRMLLEVYA